MHRSSCGFRHWNWTRAGSSKVNLFAAQPGSSCIDGVDDRLIPCATAVAARKRFPYLFPRGHLRLCQQLRGLQDYAGSAVPALERRALEECLLQGSDSRRRRRTFNGFDGLAVGLDRQHQTASHHTAVDNNVAGAAGTVLTPDVATGQSHVVPQPIHQRTTYWNARAHCLPFTVQAISKVGSSIVSTERFLSRQALDCVVEQRARDTDPVLGGAVTTRHRLQLFGQCGARRDTRRAIV